MTAPGQKSDPDRIGGVAFGVQLGKRSHPAAQIEFPEAGAGNPPLRRRDPQTSPTAAGPDAAAPEEITPTPDSDRILRPAFRRQRAQLVLAPRAQAEHEQVAI